MLLKDFGGCGLVALCLAMASVSVSCSGAPSDGEQQPHSPTSGEGEAAVTTAAESPALVESGRTENASSRPLGIARSISGIDPTATINVISPRSASLLPRFGLIARDQQSSQGLSDSGDSVEADISSSEESDQKSGSNDKPKGQATEDYGPLYCWPANHPAAAESAERKLFNAICSSPPTQITINEVVYLIVPRVVMKTHHSVMFQAISTTGTLCFLKALAQLDNPEATILEEISKGKDSELFLKFGGSQVVNGLKWIVNPIRQVKIIALRSCEDGDDDDAEDEDDEGGEQIADSSAASVVGGAPDATDDAAISTSDAVDAPADDAQD